MVLAPFVGALYGLLLLVLYDVDRCFPNRAERDLSPLGGHMARTIA